jgi:uncharacterized protein (DUF1697 family)
MPRYAAFLRGVSPMNAKMPELKAAFEAAGFTDVKTVLSSGNVVFSAPRAASSSLERRAEAAMNKHLGRDFLTIVRPVDALRAMLESDPYTAFRLAPGAKRIVTFLREKPSGGNRAVDRAGWRATAVHRRSGRLWCLRPEPERAGLHDADREDVGQGRDDADVGDRREGRTLTNGQPRFSWMKRGLRCTST